MYIYQFQDPGDFMPENNSAIITCAWTQHSTSWLKFFLVLNVQALKLLCLFFRILFISGINMFSN